MLETNVHFPTDVNLLWDAGCKSLDMIEDAIEEGILGWKGWRKGKYWRRALKKLMRMSAKASSGGGKNKEEHKKEQVRSYLELSRNLSEKIGAGLLAIYERVITANQVEMHAKKIEALEYFHGMMNKQIDLVERRVIRNETIPAEEKIHSLFEPHTEWLCKGKFDKGFYKKENKELLSLYIPAVIMPKKGKKNKAEQEEESGRTFKNLRHKRSAIESDINRLEHHGLDSCPDKGLMPLKDIVRCAC